MNKTKIQIKTRLRVMLGRTIALGPGKIQLLELLQKHGSITKAAKEMEMSYMRAWTLIRTMNSCFKKPLVVATHGGARGGGGAELTADGRRILLLYKKMDARCQNAVGPMEKKLKNFL